MGNTHKRTIRRKQEGINWFNEYYTTYEEVEFLFTQFIMPHQLENKVVYCPCDSEKSALTI